STRLSQPFDSLLPSQSAKLKAQLPLHRPVAQLLDAMLTAPTAGHFTLQPAPGNPLATATPVAPPVPQLSGSLSTRFSQPFDSLLLSQSAKPLAQSPLHRPVAQVRLAMLRAPTIGQDTLQPAPCSPLAPTRPVAPPRPQLSASLSTRFSQPF